MSDSAGELTTLLKAWSKGDREAEARLLPLVYEELRRQAGFAVRGERHEHTLRPTAVVHEVYLRLAAQDRALWQNRTQFFAVAARLMRRVLVDHARERGAKKRAGDQRRVELREDAAATAPPDAEILALDAALAELAALDPRRAQLVELRYFGGLTLEETAVAMETSEATVSRDWQLARAWLHRRLSAGAGAPPPAVGEA